jgi:hypothetical protein
VPGLSRLGRFVSSTVEKECARTRFVGLEGDCTETFSASLIGLSVVCVAFLDEVATLEIRVSRPTELAGRRFLISGSALGGVVGVKEKGVGGGFERSMPGRITGLQ